MTVQLDCVCCRFLRLEASQWHFALSDQTAVHGYESLLSCQPIALSGQTAVHGYESLLSCQPIALSGQTAVHGYESLLTYQPIALSGQTAVHGYESLLSCQPIALSGQTAVHGYESLLSCPPIEGKTDNTSTCYLLTTVTVLLQVMRGLVLTTGKHLLYDIWTNCPQSLLSQDSHHSKGLEIYKRCVLLRNWYFYMSPTRTLFRCCWTG